MGDTDAHRNANGGYAQYHGNTLHHRQIPSAFRPASKAAIDAHIAKAPLSIIASTTPVLPGDEPRTDPQPQPSANSDSSATRSRKAPNDASDENHTATPTNHARDERVKASGTQKTNDACTNNNSEAMASTSIPGGSIVARTPVVCSGETSLPATAQASRAPATTAHTRIMTLQTWGDEPAPEQAAAGQRIGGS